MNSNREYWLVKYYFYPITYDENFVQSEIIAFEKKEKARRIEPSIPLLVDGVSSRVGRLRAYGNAIVPQVAVEIIKAYMKARP